MRRIFAVSVVAMLAVLALLPTAQAQKFDCTPVDMSDFWNADAWYHDDLDDPVVGTNHPDYAGNAWVLDGGSTERIKITTLPENVIPGQANLTEDGEVVFLLPKMEVGDLDGYYAAGDTIPVPEGKYKYLFLACMSGSGNWPGSESQWAAIQDIDTKEILDPRYEVNSFKPIYAEGEGDWIPVGLVNDWFWKVPEWVAPESGDADEIIVDWLTYDGHADDILYLWDYVGMSNHDYGQYHYVNGADNYFMYIIDVIPEGTQEATLWTEMWGNVKLSISRTDADEDFEVLYDSSVEDQVYTAPAGNIDGYYPNRELRSFDLAPYLDDGTNTTIFLKFEDAAPANAEGEENNPWGARCRSLGVFTGPTKSSSLGGRLWPGLVRADGNSPTGGLILIKKKYVLDDTKTLQSITLPNNTPRGNPILTLFGMTLANEGTGTGIGEFMLY